MNMVWTLAKSVLKPPSVSRRCWRYDLQRQDNTYDALGHLLMQKQTLYCNTSEQNNNLHLEHINQSQTIDRWGNMLSFTNAQGYQTRYEYNAFNQVISQEMPEVHVVDAQGIGRSHQASATTTPTTKQASSLP